MMKSNLGTVPFIIAEMSGNHNQSLERALAIVEAAAAAGVSALKIQTYTADTMTIDSDLPDFVINDPKSLWNGRKLYDLYKEAATPWEWHKPIFDRCKKLGIIGFSTPFDETAVDFLESLNVPMYKIASFELVDIPLIKKVAATGKPIIMSTGMATTKEIKEAVSTAKRGGCKQIILLKCTSTYPAEPRDTNLLTIPDMKKRFKCQIGISDHTMGIGVALASIPLGAAAIEKHFTLSRKTGGVDSAFSIEPLELKELVEETRNVCQAIGKIKYGPTVQEKNSLIYRRSIYIVKDMKAGEVFTRENLRVIRPGFGLPSKELEMVLGKKINREALRGTALTRKMTSK
jgi:pseudaminic acid synthase